MNTPASVILAGGAALATQSFVKSRQDKKISDLKQKEQNKFAPQNLAKTNAEARRWAEAHARVVARSQNK